MWRQAEQTVEGETEGSPLLRTFTSTPRRRNICRRIPSEVAITGVILGLFLLVVTLLIVLENLDSSSKEELTLDSKLLASPFNSGIKGPDQSLKDKKKEKPSKDDGFKKLDEVKDYVDDWRKSYIVDLYKKSPEASKKPLTETQLEEMFKFASENGLDSLETVLGSPFSYNKKALDTTWQEKKEKFIKDSNSKKFDSVDKGWKKIYPLGSPFMVDREEFDADRNNFEKKLESMKYDPSDLGSPLTNEIRKLYEQWEAAKSLLRTENKVNGKENKQLGSMPNFFSNKSADFPAGCPMCPFSEAKNSVDFPGGCPMCPFAEAKLQAADTSQIVNCALLVEDIRRNLGTCIDVSFLPRECKPIWKNKCFSTYIYRKIDGTCNNQMHPTWGKSGTPYVRMIAPDYSDGVSKVRTAISGEELPNARLLSQKLYTKKMKPDIDVTLLFLSFGLIVDHDMVETAINSDGIPCCDSKFETFPKSLPRECLQIYVPKDDPFYGPRNVKCLNFVRSIPTHGECIGRREQLNKATSFLDGSAIYGSTITKAKSLRSFSNGQLRTERINDTPYMAYNEGSGYNCGTPSEPLKCFTAGDSRVNMLVELTAMHTLWYREHNRLAEELHKLNPQWTDETLYQEARKILIAQLQHITYNEFLPLLLGESAMEYFQLTIEPNHYYDAYDDTVDPSVFNGFGAAAFRFGHSLVKGMINLVGANNKTEGSIALHKTYFNPQLLYHNGLDLLLRGATSQTLQSVDSFISNEVREHLFQPANRDFGHDLAAVGIQRGRDHGLPSYTKWRSACGLRDLDSWDDLLTVMNPERAQKLKEVYRSIEDIDLIPGALAEDQEVGSLLGPTYLCIIGRQFKKTRIGDRFWFEMQDKIGSFTRDQLQEIYNSSMARIICDNSDKIQSIQKFPFRAITSYENSILNCEDIPKLDLSKWKARVPY